MASFAGPMAEDMKALGLTENKRDSAATQLQVESLSKATGKMERESIG